MANDNTVYRAPKAATLNNPVTNAVPFAKSSDSTTAAAVFIPQVVGTSSISFKVRARGRFTTGTSGNAAISLQFGTSSAASTNTVVAAPTTQTCAANCSFWLEATFAWDTTSQQLINSYTAMNGSTAAIVVYVQGTTVTGVDLSASGNAICAAALFGTSNAGNYAYLDELSLEVL